jgi:hypothetical protein
MVRSTTHPSTTPLGAASSPSVSPSGRRELALVVVAASALLVLFAWPWVRQAATAIPDAAGAGNVLWGADARLIVYILGWDVHALLTQPLHLFDAGIFHPARGMLAGSEHFLGLVPLSGPVLLASDNPLLAANLAAMATYVLAAVAMWALLRALDRPGLAAGVGAAAFALGPLRVPADLHVLQYPNYLLPLLVLASGRAQRGRVGWLVFTTTLAAFSSYYLAAMAGVLLGVEAVLALPTAGWRPALRIGAAALPGFLVLAVCSLPYLGQIDAAPPDAATLATVGAVLQPRLLDPGDTLFGVGWAAAALGIIGMLAPALRWRRPDVTWYRWVTLVLVGLLFAAGPTLTVRGIAVPLPAAALSHTPLRALRALARFVILADVGVAGLAADGAALLLWWAGRFGRTSRLLLGVALLGAAIVPRARELPSLPRTALPTGADVPAVYRWLARSASGPLLEMPGPSLSSALAQGDAMVMSLVHHLPLVNGHTGFAPWWFPVVSDAVARLPQPGALQRVVDLTGLRWILVPRARVSSAELARWETFAEQNPEVERVSAGDADGLLLHVLLQPVRPWAAALAAGRPLPGRTLLGTPLAPLLESAARGRLDAVRAAETAVAGRDLPLTLRVTNEGTADWPALLPPGSADTGLVVVRAEWRGRAGGSAPGTPGIRLPRDVVPGEALVFTAWVTAPPAPGVYTLALTLEQVDGARFPAASSADVAIEVTPRHVQ